jgi:phenylalanyl-tRNA synthetase alpha chain
MLDQLNSLGAAAVDRVRDAQTLADLEAIRVGVLGKKGSLSEVLRGLGQAAPADRPRIGAIANEWKVKIEAALAERKASLEAVALNAQLQRETIDVTLPGRVPFQGGLHPISQTVRDLVGIFKSIGFNVTLGPEAETEYLCFEAVNIPANHPARDMQDTFFLGPGVVLRTHTTPVQMRTMLSQKWPVRVVCPGAVYRCDHDATHSPMFHQIEALWVDRGVRMSDLRGVLELFVQKLFGSETKIRLRPSFFPFVEPGAEVDASCPFCRKRPSASDPCKVCKGSGWIEILGAGMVHPRLFQAAGYAGAGDHAEISGFAFGLGIERIAILRYQIPDIRLMFGGDLRFLSQFGGS